MKLGVKRFLFNIIIYLGYVQIHINIHFETNSSIYQGSVGNGRAYKHNIHVWFTSHYKWKRGGKMRDIEREKKEHKRCDIR